MSFIPVIQADFHVVPIPRQLNLSSFFQYPLSKERLDKYENQVTSLVNLSRDTSYAGLILVDDDDEVVAVFQGSSKYFTCFEVRPKYRRKNIGSLMLDYAVARFGFTTLVVPKFYKETLLFFAKRGWSISEQKTSFVTVTYPRRF
jgi:ribosomal protein S18 acetylase RimI-like enzyme